MRQVLYLRYECWKQQLLNQLFIHFCFQMRQSINTLCTTIFSFTYWLTHSLTDSITHSLTPCRYAQDLTSMIISYASTHSKWKFSFKNFYIPLIIYETKVFVYLHLASGSCRCFSNYLIITKSCELKTTPFIYTWCRYNNSMAEFLKALIKVPNMVLIVYLINVERL